MWQWGNGTSEYIVEVKSSSKGLINKGSLLSLHLVWVCMWEGKPITWTYTMTESCVNYPKTALRIQNHIQKASESIQTEFLSRGVNLNNSGAAGIVCNLGYAHLQHCIEEEWISTTMLEPRGRGGHWHQGKIHEWLHFEVNGVTKWLCGQSFVIGTKAKLNWVGYTGRWTPRRNCGCRAVT